MHCKCGFDFTQCQLEFEEGKGIDFYVAIPNKKYLVIFKKESGILAFHHLNIDAILNSKTAHNIGILQKCQECSRFLFLAPRELIWKYFKKDETTKTTYATRECKCGHLLCFNDGYALVRDKDCCEFVKREQALLLASPGDARAMRRAVSLIGFLQSCPKCSRLRIELPNDSCVELYRSDD